MALLERLLDADGGVSVAGLAAAVGVTREQAIASVEKLRAAGCRIDEHPQHGLMLIASGLGCWADYLEGRHVGGIGRRCVVYRETASTQHVARQTIGRSDPPEGSHGTVFLSDHQSAGRGRLGRRWTGRAGTQVLMTAVVEAAGFSVDRLMLGACHAICEAVEGLTGLETRIRWPNDVLIGGRKLAGILIETTGPNALVGIGLNVSLDPGELAAPLRERVTSLRREGRPVDRLRLLDALLGRLNEAFDGVPVKVLLDQWRARSCLLERRITVDCDGARLTGRVVDLDPRDGLMLAVERGPIVRLPAATTSLVEASGVS